MLAKEFDGVSGNSVLEKSLKTQNRTSGTESAQGTKTTQKKENNLEKNNATQGEKELLFLVSVQMKKWKTT